MELRELRIPGTKTLPSSSRADGAFEWHLITSEYPPAIGGVSDYTFTMAGALGRTSTVHVWCPPSAAVPPEQPGVRIHTAGFSVSRLRGLGRGLDANPAPRRLFVQWTPQGFGYRSLNLAFAWWLVWRRMAHGDIVDVMVHEPYLRWSMKPTRFVAALMHRLMLLLACCSATRVWVSTTAWLGLVRPYLWTQAPLQWLPLPAPALIAHGRPAPSSRADREVRVGHFSMFSPLITPMLAPALDVVLDRTDASILLIGHGSDECKASLIASRPDWATRVQSTGASSGEDVRVAIQRCDVMLQPYPDGVTSRRTSMLTAMALGVPTVTNTGTLTESFWRELAGPALVDGPDGRALGERAVELIADTKSHLQRGTACRSSYERLFDVERAVALLDDAAVN